MKFGKYLLKVSAGLLMIGLILKGTPTMVHAAEEGSMNYQVKANLPASQRDTKVTYFDLRLKPKQEETISLTIQNNDAKAHVFKVVPNTAITNDNGVVDYSQAKKNADKTAPVNIRSLITGDQKVTVPANAAKDVTFKIKMPAKSFDGVLLGGFNISREGKTGNKTQSSGVTIENQFAYVIGLRITETDKEITPSIKLNAIKAGLINYRTAVTANLENPTATMISGMKVDAQVMKRGSNKVLHRTKKDSVSMAPNSNFDYAISWDNTTIAAGKYTLKLTATDKAGRKWHFTRNFEITDKKAHNANQKAVDLKKETFNWWYVVAGVVVLILLSYIIYLKRKEKKA